jgi:hypothetical protein
MTIPAVYIDIAALLTFLAYVRFGPRLFGSRPVAPGTATPELRDEPPARGSA